MFSRIDQIPGTPRRVETTDPRMDIDRHDADYIARRRKKQNETPDLLESVEDGAQVSTTALLSFLENFVQTLPDQKIVARGNADDVADISPPEEALVPQQPIDPTTARAARAYQSTARAVHDRNVAAPTPADPSAGASLLGSEDIRTIYRLIEDVRVLVSRNIESLSLERAPSFLTSLVAAVEKALR